MKGFWNGALVALLALALLGGLGCAIANLGFAIGIVGMNSAQNIFGTMLFVSSGTFVLAGGLYFAWVLRLKDSLPPNLAAVLTGAARISPWVRLEGALRTSGDPRLGEVAARLRRLRIGGIVAGVPLAATWAVLGNTAIGRMNVTTSLILMGLSLLWSAVLFTFLQQVRLAGALVRRPAF